MLTNEEWSAISTTAVSVDDPSDDAADDEDEDGDTADIALYGDGLSAPCSSPKSTR